MKIETTRKMKNFKYVLMVFAGGGMPEFSAKGLVGVYGLRNDALHRAVFGGDSQNRRGGRRDHNDCRTARVGAVRGGGFRQKGGGTPSCGNRRNAFRNRPHEPPQGAGWLTPNGTDSAPAPRAILAKLLDSIADIIRIFRLIFYFKNTCIWL